MHCRSSDACFGSGAGARSAPLLAATVVVLGAWVRLTDAGLGCPDWPGCYGHIFPQADSQFRKAVHEMIHRYFATHARRHHRRPARLGAVEPQGSRPAAHGRGVAIRAGVPAGRARHHDRDSAAETLDRHGALAGRPLDLGLLWWLSLTPERRQLPSANSRLRKFALFGLAALALQIALGGWTSSNYAAVACPDLPTCQRSWWPDMDFPRRLRSVARTRHRLRRRRARESGAGRHSRHASPRRGHRGLELLIVMGLLIVARSARHAAAIRAAACWCSRCCCRSPSASRWCTSVCRSPGDAAQRRRCVPGHRHRDFAARALAA